MKRMQISVCLVIFGFICTVSSRAQEGFTLPIFDAGAPEHRGSSRVAGGITVGEQTLSAGVRGSLWILDGFQVFAELDWMNWHRRGVGPNIQLGAMYTLPADIPADVATRFAVYKPFADEDRDMAGVTLCGVLGRDLEAFVPGVSVYGAAGFDWAWGTVELPDGRSRSADDFTPIVSVGAQYRISDELSVHCEAMLDDRIFGGIAMGIRF